MKKLIVASVAAMTTFLLRADGVFTVTHYNVEIGDYLSVMSADEIRFNSSTWKGAPITRTYRRIAFIHYLDATRKPHFRGNMVAFPGVPASSTEIYVSFVVEITGTISIPEAGYWTFACGSDDDIMLSIKGHTIDDTFIANGGAFTTSFNTIYFPVAGKYNLRLLYRNGISEAAVELSIAQGSYSSFNSSFHLVEAAESGFTISYNANDGTGTMDAQTYEDGKAQKLSKNTYCKDGYVFQGWAETKADADNGFVKYHDEAEITVNSDMTLYAVWANPALTLTAESADWSSGSITLRCEDSDTSSSRHRYSLFYYDPSVGFWRIVDSARNIEVDANGKVFLTDAGYSARLDGIPTVQYRVTDENGRMSECETRNRHGLFVAIDLYENRPNIGLVEPPSPTQAAAAFRGAYAKHGDAAGYLWTLENWDAKKNEITNRLDFIAENYSRPGDVFLFYYAGHGFNGGVACYDFEKSLSARELSESFKRFPSGVGVVAIINACCSASMIDMGDVVGNVQVAWIASSQESENTKAGVFDSIVCDRGWLKGGADFCDPTGAVGGNGDGYVTFGELAMWGQQLSGKTYYRYRMLTDLKNSSMLDNIVAGRVPSHASVTPLTDGPSTLTALPGSAGEIRLSWTAVSGASGYDIYRKLSSARPNTYVYVDTVKGTNTRDGSSYALTPNVEYEYYVRAVNDVYVSDASPTASCAPSENMKIRDYVSRFMSSLSTSSINYSEHPAMVNGEVDYSNLNYDHDGDGMTTFEEYVAGTNPADEADRFVASIKIEDGRPAISWSPNLNTNGSERVYTVWGKTNLYDEVGWTSPTNSGHRFFTVGVEMP